MRAARGLSILVDTQLVLLYVLVIATNVISWDISLSFEKAAYGAVGGEPFFIQPIISVFNKKRTKKHISLEGRIEAEIINFGDDSEQLRLWNGSSCETSNEDQKISVALVEGEAIFDGLCINKQGEGYKIKYTLKDEFNLSLGDIVGDPLSVVVGNPYRIGVIQQPALAYGGEPWGIPPIVAVQDRGFNTVPNVNNGIVSVELVGHNTVESLRLDSNHTYSYQWINGTVEFAGIFIDTAEVSYILKFSTDLLLEGGSECFSSEFIVETGEPDKLVIVEEPSQSKIFGGKAFVHQPLLKLVDKGGNVVMEGVKAFASISLYNKPDGGYLSPWKNMFAPIVRGFVQFKELKINKAGKMYQFKYSLWKVNEDDSFNDTEKVTIGSSFDVEIGIPSQLRLDRYPQEMWAGNQPFVNQPKLSLTDSGGNILIDDSTTTVTAMVVPSLSYNSNIKIDTSKDPIPEIVRIYFDSNIDTDEEHYYSAGHRITINVDFTQEVSSILKSEYNMSEAILPSLQLNIQTHDDIPATAVLAENNDQRWSRTLQFAYLVKQNHEYNGFNFTNPTAIHDNDYIIIDRWNRPVYLEVYNNLAYSKIYETEMKIDSTPSFIQNITINESNGTYGAGSTIPLFVAFSRKVGIVGTPYLPLNIKSSVAIIDTISLGTSRSKSYFHISYRGEKSKSIPWDASSNFLKDAIEAMNVTSGRVCVSRASSIETGGFRWAIRFDTVEDNIYDKLHLEPATVYLDHESIELNLDIHLLDRPYQDWQNIDGDAMMCTERSAQYVQGRGTKLIKFDYTVLPGDYASFLALKSSTLGEQLIYSTNDGVSNWINDDESSIVKADLKLLDESYIRLSNIIIDTSPPSIQSVTVLDIVSLDSTLYFGDIIFIEVSFNKPVVIYGKLHLLLNVGRRRNFAEYFSGSGTSSLVFRYVVLEGHKSEALEYSGDSALKLIDDVGYVRHLSLIPVTNAILDLPTPQPLLWGGAKIIVNGRQPKILNISIASGPGAKTFRERDQIPLLVQFTSNVVVNKGPPVLILTVGDEWRQAEYTSGNGTDKILFNYTVLIGDKLTNSGLICKMICVASGCLEGVPYEGYIWQSSADPGLNADLTIPKFIRGQKLEGVIIDTTSAPQTVVESVSSSHSSGSYGVGEIIRFFVKFSDIVYNQGSRPELYTNTNKTAFYESGLGSDTLIFVLETSFTDAIDALDWAIAPFSDSPIICSKNLYPPCDMRNANGNEIDDSFVDDTGNYKIESLQAKISIDFFAPKVIEVYANTLPGPSCPSILASNSCTYTAGDKIDIHVKFDLPVMIIGNNARIKMSAQNHLLLNRQQELYAVYDVSASNDTVLVFTYDVREGDSTYGANLQYECNSTVCHIDAEAIYRKSSIPTVAADLKLPSQSNLTNTWTQQIIVEGLDIPYVYQVRALSDDGVYYPGDSVLIEVIFSDNVHVSGIPFLYLDATSKPDELVLAYYKSGSNSRILLFEFFVESHHSSLHLEYIDIHSLQIDSGNIYRASAMPMIITDCRLPVPGSLNSLSSSSNIILDSSRPHIESIWSPTKNGKYITDDIVLIRTQFSKPISITGTPSILLETGSVDREAIFSSQIDQATIEFKYTIQLGDISNQLDYWTSEELIRSSSSSFRLNGGSIKLSSSKPIVEADLHLNPSGGVLDGDTDLTMVEGEVEYSNIKLGKRGHGYKMVFTAKPDHSSLRFEQVISINITESCEFELSDDDDFNRDYGDYYGSAVSLKDDLIVIGAPYKKQLSPEIQVLTVKSESIIERPEVQLITTQLNSFNATKQIQRIITSASNGSFISGSFSLKYVHNNYLYGSSIIIPSDASADQVKILVSEALPVLGHLEVTRENNGHCKCENAWVWAITISDASQGVSLLQTDGSNLLGDNATVSGEIVRYPDMMNGYFVLENPFDSSLTRNISYDESAEDMKKIIEEDLNIKVKTVMAANLNDRNIPELGRRWTITFSHFISTLGIEMNVPNLQVYDSSISGLEAKVWCHVGFEGRSPLSGNFAVSFRGSSFSDFMPYDASPEQIKTALESIESVNTVNVSQRTILEDISDFSGSSWTITFLSVNYLTEHGWLIDVRGGSSHGNLPPLKVASKLIGWNAHYNVEHVSGFGSDDNQAQWMEKAMGDDGTKSGQVSVYLRGKDTWSMEYVLRAVDGDSHDSFGHSVSVHDSYIAVGAPSKERNGEPEVQELSCQGLNPSGSFRIFFRGQYSDDISHNATLEEIRAAIVTIYGNTTHIHTFPGVIIEGNEWMTKNSGFCSSDKNIIFITLWTPDGGGVSTMSRSSGDVESIQIDSTRLYGAEVFISELSKGTRSLSGSNFMMTSGEQSGAVYLYRRNKECEFCTYYWYQANKLNQIDGYDHPQDSAQFGWRIRLASIDGFDGIFLFIGSPGADFYAGIVYVFLEMDSKWSFNCKLTDESSTRKSGDRFGHDISVNGDTILIGAPGHQNETGSVHVFQKAPTIGFLPSQVIYGPKDIKSGAQFGHAVALHGNRAIICAPYEHMHLNLAREKTGSCFAYSRQISQLPFVYSQQLTPSNTEVRDRFGWSVDMTADRAVIGQLESFTGNLAPSAPVQILTIFSDDSFCNGTLSGSFQLSWRENTVVTREIDSSISAKQLKDILQNDLKTDSVRVVRSELPDKHGGHQWSITFTAYGLQQKGATRIPLLECNAQKMTGCKPSCSVVLKNDLPENIRSKVHLFTLQTDLWTEQAYLFPVQPQSQDLFGASVAIHGTTALVGAPNRHSLNINSGAAFAYSLDFSYFYFPLSSYSVLEGENISIPVRRSNATTKTFLRLMTGNISEENTNSLSFRSPDLDTRIAFRSQIKATFNFYKDTASGKLPYYNTEEYKNLWMRGLYDYQGNSDYKTINKILSVSESLHEISINLETIDDMLHETPDEYLTVRIAMPGIIASPLGNLVTNITIHDNDDGLGAFQTNHRKILSDEGANHDMLGSSFDIERTTGLLVIGNEMYTKKSEDGKQYIKNGIAYIYHHVQGRWSLTHELIPQEWQDNMYFGNSIAVGKPYRRSDVTILIGAPGKAAAYIFVSKGDTWEKQAILRPPEDFFINNHNDFPTKGAVALKGDLAFIGVKAMEAVVIYRRIFKPNGVTEWEVWSVLRSHDYDYDIYNNGNTVQHVHKQLFGISLATSGRILLVGAPHADYGNRGDVKNREFYDTDGIHNEGLGKGKVYSFFSQPFVKSIHLRLKDTNITGAFILKVQKDEVSYYSKSVDYDSDSTGMKDAIETVEGIGEVEVETKSFTDSDGSIYKCWTITFLSIFYDDFKQFEVLGSDNACEDCDMLGGENTTISEHEMWITADSGLSSFSQEYEIQPNDVISGDGFGYTIDIDNDEAIIGAMFSAGKTRTTWDFETGDLIGWVRTGNAFDYQPTFGDNSRRRTVYKGFGSPHSETTGAPQASNMRGRYYIGTFEKRPGAGTAYYTKADIAFDEGDTQGDDPIGTLTSDPFMIRGEWISFLIGGGCCATTEYVELIIDGFATMRETGKCDESMERAYWQVSDYRNRTAQIRIVDAGQGLWGHINVDDFRFSWVLKNKCHDSRMSGCDDGGASLPKSHISDYQHYTGREESPMAGVAYLFSRDCKRNSSNQLIECFWVENQRLIASDKRNGNLFGSAVTIDTSKGIAVVGSPHAPVYGLYQQTPNILLNNNSSFVDFPINPKLENYMKSGNTLSPIGDSLRVIDQIMNQQIFPDQYLLNELHKKAGMLYFYVKNPEERDSDGVKVKSAFWSVTENARIAPPTLKANDFFASKVATFGSTIIAGSPGDDSSNKEDSGAIYILDNKWLGIRFSQVEYVAVEGIDSEIEIQIQRDEIYSHERIEIGYSTNDLSAVGVDTWKFENCQERPVEQRNGCGDFEHSSGLIVLEKEEINVNITIRILDDLCWERHLEYAQLILHIPGGGPIQGEGYRAHLRIDDDDWINKEGVFLNCTYRAI